MHLLVGNFLRCIQLQSYLIYVNWKNKLEMESVGIIIKL
jgi:hypothetical protein